MENHWAAEHLQVIRTLMERSALYRRALAPVMVATGSLGAAAAALGWFVRIESPRAFALYWMLVSLLAIGSTLMLVRKQALRAEEAFWSPPTRRVAQAMLPALFCGLLAGLFLGLRPADSPRVAGWLACVWMSLYGCAVHSAGFFVPRRMRLFGWLFIALGAATLAVIFNWADPPAPRHAHLLMGASFGLLHLACGAYLQFTETRDSAS